MEKKELTRMTVGDLISQLQEYDTSRMVHIFSTDNGDDVRAHQIQEIHAGWFIEEEGNICIQINRSRELVQQDDGWLEIDIR